MKTLHTLLLTALITAAPSMAQTTINEQQALDFLYSAMPLPDRADYSPEFYQKNVRATLTTRQQVPWGKTIPDDIFRHFVLPIRVNNEHLDEARTVLYKQLRPRVEHLSMYDAILEVNHWCHEHVTYRPSDARTSSPLASIKTAYGRCGEESTLLVAALRAVGIPARQVYTPRWAHTDDNHAWVEAWADGRWYFLGACEPEPVLNLGWFNESASRGMLMHTKVVGDYHGPEEVMSKNAYFTEINVVDNYAPVTTKTVQVVDEQGAPISGATVEMKIYNYAEFFTVTRKQTDANGNISLTAGKGDMVAWVSKDNHWTMAKVDFRDPATTRVVLPCENNVQARELDIVPPRASLNTPKVTAEQRAENDRRFAYEDSIRHAYEATLHPEWRGNQDAITLFLGLAGNRIMAQKLLQVISPKDLRDVDMGILLDNIVHTKTVTSDIYCRYVLCPRVENEWLTPYKGFFKKHLPKLKTAEKIDQWCKANIKIDNSQNPGKLRMTPIGVYSKRVADELSYKIFWVAVARTNGIPARINEVDGRLQAYCKGQWQEITVKPTATTIPATGSLKLTYEPTKYLDNPVYYTHFTISKMVDGSPQLLTYPEEVTYKDLFKKGVTLPTGQYMLTTGTRMADGSVLSHVSFFDIKQDVMTTCPLEMRQSDDQIQVIGSLNAENIYYDAATNSDRSLLSTAGRGYYVVALVAPNQEPTNHALRDISIVKEQLEKWGRKMIVLFRNDNEAARFNHSEFTGLPSTLVWGTDQGGKIEQELRSQLHISEDAPLPIFVIADSFNRIVGVWQGYTIGLGEQMMKVINKL